MRLTQTLRKAFINAVMNDVPTIDYRRDIQKYLYDECLKAMPADVRKAYKNHPNWFSPNGINIGNVGYFYLPVPDGFKFNTDVVAHAEQIRKNWDAQTRMLNDLRKKLIGAVTACNTDKALRELLPEFEKYVPVNEKPVTQNLPAIANVVSAFAQAGWPKDQKKAA